MTIKVSKPAKGLREAIAEIIGRGASVINGMTKGDAQDELEVSRKNWIINGDMQVSQRGDYTSATAASNAVYYLDRWKSLVNVVTGTVQDNTGWQKWAATSTGTGKIGAIHIIEDHSSISDEMVTISALVKSNHNEARILWYDGANWVASSAHSGDGSEELLTITTSSAVTSSNQLRLNISNSDTSSVSITSGDYIEFTNVKLEIGDTATPFESRSYAEELRDCQRYYWQGEAVGSGIAYQYGISGSYKQGPIISFPVHMRVDPTVAIVTAPTYINCTHGDIVHQTDGAIHRVSITSTGDYRAYDGVYSAAAELP